MRGEIVPDVGRNRQVLHEMHDMSERFESACQRRLTSARKARGERVEVGLARRDPIEGIADRRPLLGRRHEARAPHHIRADRSEFCEPAPEVNETRPIADLRSRKRSQRVVEVVAGAAWRLILQSRANLKPLGNSLRPSVTRSEVCSTSGTKSEL